ncbi:MAG: FeoB-associated Cys-rich membrane protein [Pirellulaceae bacterium]
MSQSLIVLLIIAVCVAYLVRRALPKPGQAKKACGGGCDNCGSQAGADQTPLVQLGTDLNNSKSLNG